MKRFSVLGDSISTFEGMVPEGNAVYYRDADARANGVVTPANTWWMQVIDRLDGALLANGSFSGSLVAGESFPAGRAEQRAAQLIGADGAGPDAVLVYLGINDYGEGTDPVEFERAYGEMLANVRAKAPHADIFCMTLLPGRSEEHDVSFFREKYKGHDLEDYNRAIRRAAPSADAQVVDVALIGEPFDTLDGTHPTRKGMRQLAETFLKALSR